MSEVPTWRRCISFFQNKNFLTNTDTNLELLHFLVCLRHLRSLYTRWSWYVVLSSLWWHTVPSPNSKGPFRLKFIVEPKQNVFFLPLCMETKFEYPLAGKGTVITWKPHGNLRSGVKSHKRPYKNRSHGPDPDKDPDWKPIKNRRFLVHLLHNPNLAMVRFAQGRYGRLWPFDLPSGDCRLVCCDSVMLTHDLRPRQNGRHFADDTFKCIFLNEDVLILIYISLKFVPKGPINNISAWVEIMTWRRPGDKPLSKPMLVSLLTHICVTRPQWVNWVGIC